MAGLYPDVPGHRFAYDTDGTLLRYRVADGSLVTTTSAAPFINDEDTGDYVEYGGQATGNQFAYTGGFATGHYLTFVFPQVRDVVAYWLYGAVQAVSVTTHRSDIIQTSVDTTDGSDGTWVTRQAANFLYSTATFTTRMRDAIVPLSGATGIKGIRFGFAHDNTSASTNDWFRIYALHLYGYIVGANNGLRFWHPTLDQEMDKATFDFGDMPQSVVSVKQFRLKNTSSQVANNTILSAETPSGSDALLTNGLNFSQDGTAYTTTTTVTSIAAGATSPVLYVRRTVPPTEVAGTRASRVKAIVGSWT